MCIFPLFAKKLLCSVGERRKAHTKPTLSRIENLGIVQKINTKTLSQKVGGEGEKSHFFLIRFSIKYLKRI